MAWASARVQLHGCHRPKPRATRLNFDRHLNRRRPRHEIICRTSLFSSPSPQCRNDSVRHFPSPVLRNLLLPSHILNRHRDHALHRQPRPRKRTPSKANHAIFNTSRAIAIRSEIANRLPSRIPEFAKRHSATLTTKFVVHAAKYIFAIKCKQARSDVGFGVGLETSQRISSTHQRLEGNHAALLVGSGVGIETSMCISSTRHRIEGNNARLARDGPGLPAVRFVLTNLNLPPEIAPPKGGATKSRSSLVTYRSSLSQWAAPTT